jgi:hypothetical protein
MRQSVMSQLPEVPQDEPEDAVLFSLNHSQFVRKADN